MLDTGVLIRDFTLDDLPDVDRLRRATQPWYTASLETQRIWIRTTPEAAKAVRRCAEIDGQVVGFAFGALELTAVEPGVAFIQAVTDPDFRGRGVGGALYAHIEGDVRGVGARRVQLQALDEPVALAWGQRLGFELGATDRFLVVDPRTLPPMPATPDGVSMRTAAEAGSEDLYHVDNIAAQDEPGDVGFAGMPYGEWLDRFWSVCNREASIVAYVDGAPAAATQLDVNLESGRAMSQGSGTLPRYRGRGLLKLAKSVSLRRAAEMGVTSAFTGNDATNKPMLAINDWLGYRYLAATRSMMKTL
jgi:GNAT superfamily N-acetyltransferase